MCLKSTICSFQGCVYFKQIEKLVLVGNSTDYKFRKYLVTCKIDFRHLQTLNFMMLLLQVLKDYHYYVFKIVCGGFTAFLKKLTCLDQLNWFNKVPYLPIITKNLRTEIYEEKYKTR